MTFSDWLGETIHRFKTKPAATALKESIDRFYDGARVRYYNIRTDGTIQTELCGEQVEFQAVDHIDIKRATTLNGEEKVAEWLFKEIDEDTIFWDVGAYNGHYSVLAAVKGATVIAFEPGDGIEVVERNAKMNRVSVDLRTVALSDRRKTMELSVGPSSEQKLGGSGQGVQTVRGVSIQPAPDIVKIDVEGHEQEVLDGMGETLDSVTRIAIEVHDVDQTGTIRKRLERHGMNVIELQSNRTQTYLGGFR